MKGTVFNIQKFCVNDGPGIRTVVFLKGCPLRCAWCHNPESHSCPPELLYDASKCVSCGRCAAVCPNGVHSFDADGKHILDRSRCTACGACADACVPGALEVSGKLMSVDEVMKEVLKDKVFYDNSGGGITLSGGEPLLQFEFSLSLLEAAKQNGLNTCIETCGYASEDKIAKIAAVTDIFLLDWKLSDSLLHKQYTGVDNERIRSNVELLCHIGARIILRCPIIPDVNDNDEHFSGIAELANSYACIEEIQIEPYHSLGIEKYRKVGKVAKLTDTKMPDNSTVEEWIAAIAAKTNVPVKKG